MNKTTLYATLFAAFALAGSHQANATLLVGYSNFDTPTGATYSDNTPNVSYSGIKSELTFTGPTGPATGSTGASSNTTYADGTAVTPTNSTVMLLHATSTMSWKITNELLGQNLVLSSLFFDAASTVSTHSTMTVNYSGAASGTKNFIAANNEQVLNTANPGTNTAFKRFWLDPLLDFVLAPNESITFVWNTGVGTRIDNIAVAGSLSAIPEPGSLVALGCVLGSGLVLRRRNRIVTV